MKGGKEEYRLKGGRERRERGEEREVQFRQAN